MEALIGRDVFEPLPELQHTFRPDPKMPSSLISFTFSGIVFVPWVVLLLYWLSNGALNMKKFPFARAGELLPSVLFIGGLCAYVYTMFLYWLKFNMFEMLTIVAPLCAFIALSGRWLVSFWS
ncbi:hypothetical protein MIR68_009117 [Amoeboaphelidium protococcarum]|nr:hypothetical protein MIR68_009117 [Amoeboaphelidium protococcarum]